MVRSLVHIITSFALLSSAALADNWPAWRGADGLGRSRETDLPLKWSATENVRWKVPLPDEGNSTPAVWEDKVFITQATEKGRVRATICLARKDGSKLWEQKVEHKEPEPTHNTNPFCSASPATDGKRVVVSHGSAGMFCYDMDGKELWRRELGKCHHIWGNAASPVIHGDLVILNFGPGVEQYLLAVNKQSGETVWKVDEPGGLLGAKGEKWIGSWSTPVVATIKGREELVMSWPGVIKSYDPATGKLLWSCEGLAKDGRPDALVYTSPVVAQDVVIGMAGYGGPAIGVRTGGSGDVTATHRLWRHPNASQRIGTGVIIGEHLYHVNEPGTMQCIDWKSGKSLWTERIDGGVWGSLVHAEDRLYVTRLDGETVVVAAKPKFEVLANNPLKERTLSSIAISDGQLFIRTYKHLWCIGK
jgi:outer membrane protein assembly factor BamB